MGENNSDEKKDFKKKIANRKIVINLTSSYVKHPMGNYLIKLLINTSLFIVLINYTNIAIYYSIYSVFIFAMWFSLFENMLVQITTVKFTKYIIMSFGGIFILPIVISMALATFVAGDIIEFRTTEMLLGFTVAFMTSRKVLSVLLLNSIQRYRFNKMFKKKEDK